MKTAIVIFLAVLAPVLLVLLWVRRPNVLERRIKAALSSGRNAWSTCFVDVASEAGTCQLLNEQLDAIDTGLQFTFDKARTRGWTLALDFEGYTVVILKGEKYKGVNCIRMPNGEWVAGLVTDLAKQIIVIPEPSSGELEELARIIGYEAEHIIAFHNDRDLFERTETHETGEGHPIF